MPAEPLAAPDPRPALAGVLSLFDRPARDAGTRSARAICRPGRICPALRARRGGFIAYAGPTCSPSPELSQRRRVPPVHENEPTRPSQPNGPVLALGGSQTQRHRPCAPGPKTAHRWARVRAHVAARPLDPDAVRRIHHQ